MIQEPMQPKPLADRPERERRNDKWELTRRGRALVRLARGETLEEIARELHLSCDDLRLVSDLLFDAGE